MLAFPGYGYRRVTAQLQREGFSVNHKRVVKILREESLLCELQRRWVKTLTTPTSRLRVSLKGQGWTRGVEVREIRTIIFHRNALTVGRR
jgi:helix-turn-helix protein